MIRGAGLLALVALAPLLTLSGCGSEPSQPSPRTAISPQGYDPTVGVPPHYEFFYSPGISPDKVPDTWKALPYTRIELERTACLGQCPSYVVTFHADGPAHYTGRADSPRIGEFDGEVAIWDYGQICWMIDRFKILAGPREYRANWTDAPTTIVRITQRDTGETITISDYGAQGPVELLALFNSLDAVSNRIQWSRSSE